MKLLDLILFFALATLSLAQSVRIFSPANNAKIHAGKHLTIQVQQPDSIMGSATLGIALGIRSCAPSACTSPDQSMAYVLYHGAYNPKQHGTQAQRQPFQNFTVEIPSGLTKGPAQLSVAYAALWGAAYFPSFQFDKNTVIVV